MLAVCICFDLFCPLLAAPRPSSPPRQLVEGSIICTWEASQDWRHAQRTLHLAEVSQPPKHEFEAQLRDWFFAPEEDKKFMYGYNKQHLRALWAATRPCAGAAAAVPVNAEEEVEVEVPAVPEDFAHIKLDAAFDVDF